MHTYSNFFEWYKKEKYKWDKNHPNVLYDCGIDDDLYKYFIYKYLYKGPVNIPESEKLRKIFKKHSWRYKTEILYRNIFHKAYIPKDDHYISYRNRIFSEFFAHEYDIIPNDIFIEFCESYLSEPIYFDSIGCTQANLQYLFNILEKHSLRFRFEKYLYKLFKK